MSSSKRFQVVLLLVFGGRFVFSYTQITTTGTNNSSSDTGPKIYKATHMDLIFPEVFNRTRADEDTSTETVQPKTTEAAAASIVVNPPRYNEQISAESTGRAVDYQQPYPFQQLISAGKPSNRPVYPSYMSSNRAPPRIQDRFTPGEATAAHSFNKLKNNAPYNPKPAASDTNANYVPPKNLYSFPPNSNANYPSPSEIKPEVVKPTSYGYPASGPLDNSDAMKANSYGYPASGPVDNNEFTGPINPNYLPAARDPVQTPVPNPVPQDPAPTPDDNQNDNPQPPIDVPGDDGDSHAGEINVTGDGPNPMDDHNHDHHHHHDDHDYIPGKLYPTPPPGYIPEITDDHDHHHEHFPDHDVKAFDYHDIVYDDQFFHHHHHPHPTEPAPPPPPPPTTEAPVEPPPEPRVKKYSYFYIGRKLWYIPLYFTVWFSFYVLWLILKSIARHKVNLPNHYVAKRSLPDMSHKQATEHIDKLTVYVLDNIEKFKDKYFG